MSARIDAVIVFLVKISLEVTWFRLLIVEIYLEVVLSDWFVHFMKGVVLPDRLVHIVQTFG